MKKIIFVAFLCLGVCVVSWSSHFYTYNVTFDQPLNSGGGSLSADGSIVAYFTEVPAPSDVGSVIVVENLFTGVREIASQGLRVVARPTISRNGKYVAFWGSPDGYDPRIYVYIVGSGRAPHRSPVGAELSLIFGGWEGPQIAISDYSAPYGEESLPRVVVFSHRSMIRIGEPPPRGLFFELWDMAASLTSVQLINVANNTNPPSDNIQEVAFDASGSTLAFSTSSDNLVLQNGFKQIYAVHEWEDWKVLGPSNVLSRNGASLGDSHSHNPSISVYGHRVAFNSSATNLITGVNCAGSNIFVRDVWTESTLLPYNTAVAEPRFQIGFREPALSPEGEWVAYYGFREGIRSDLLDLDPFGRSHTALFLSNLQYPNNVRLVSHRFDHSRRVRAGFRASLTWGAEALVFDSADYRRDLWDGTTNEYSNVYYKGGLIPESEY